MRTKGKNGKIGSFEDVDGDGELEVEAQVTGIGSLFGIHFTSEEIVDYRTVVRGDGQMGKAVFTGLLNEGVLLQGGAAGSLNVLTTKAEVDTLVDATLHSS